jgi:hypothetical protein
MKNIVIVGGVVIVVLVAAFVYFSQQQKPSSSTTVDVQSTQQEQQNENGRVMEPQGTQEEAQETPAPSGKIKAETFTGTLEAVDTGCFADAECSVTVDGKHVTVLMGWNRDEVGSVIGADGIGGLESFIGKQVEVYAKDNLDGTYTLYGSAGFYVKVI